MGRTNKTERQNITSVLLSCHCVSLSYRLITVPRIAPKRSDKEASNTQSNLNKRRWLKNWMLSD